MKTTHPRRIGLPETNRGRILLAVSLIVVGVGTVVLRSALKGDTPAETEPLAAVLTVALTRPQMLALPIRVPATGHILPWQEAIISTEANGLQLAEVRVNVGDRVRRGQVLAVFDPRIVETELAEASAAVVSAQAEAAQASANERRARRLEGSGAISVQEITQYYANAKLAQGRLAAAKAAAARARLRLIQTRVVASSNGIVTARTATVGAVIASGQELFRLIKDGRLEWRASVAVQDLEKVTPGQQATIASPAAPPVIGHVRITAPAIDPSTDTGLVYVDVPNTSHLRAGSFARGYIEIGASRAVTVPNTALLLRDGFSYVVRVGPASKAMLARVSVGRRIGERTEVISGLGPNEQIVASGVGFLSDGDPVRIVSGAPGAAVSSRRTIDSAVAGAAP